MRSEAQKKAEAKYEAAASRKTVGIYLRVSPETARRFRDHCREYNNRNDALGALLDYIGGAADSLPPGDEKSGGNFSPDFSMPSKA